MMPLSPLALNFHNAKQGTAPKVSVAKMAQVSGFIRQERGVIHTGAVTMPVSGLTGWCHPHVTCVVTLTNHK